ncbi:hypothetical protein AB4099_22465 [Bosea sp. 2KB_26]|uniref:hypothetical protein n=1 Tax=Bosea sp. 2KB_26 TaxID=3237475 RepID=UPI003F8E0D60
MTYLRASIKRCQNVYALKKIAIFQLEAVLPALYGDYCALAIAMYQEILAMRPIDAANLLHRIEAQ